MPEKSTWRPSVVVELRDEDVVRVLVIDHQRRDLGTGCSRLGRDGEVGDREGLVDVHVGERRLAPRARPTGR